VTTGGESPVRTNEANPNASVTPTRTAAGANVDVKTATPRAPNSKKIALIAGIAGGVVALGLICCLVVVCRRKKKNEADYDAIPPSSQVTSTTDGVGMQRSFL
jgi:hypothetical protein